MHYLTHTERYCHPDWCSYFYSMAASSAYFSVVSMFTMPPLANASLTPPNDYNSGACCEYANKYKLHLLFQQMAVSWNQPRVSAFSCFHSQVCKTKHIFFT